MPSADANYWAKFKNVAPTNSRAPKPSATSSSSGGHTAKLPKGQSIEVPSWAVGSQYDIPASNRPLIEPTPRISAKPPVVVTSREANEKLGAAEQTVDYATEAMLTQREAKRQIEAARAQQEADRQAQEDQNSLENRKVDAEGQASRDIQASLDEVKANLRAPTDAAAGDVNMTPSEEENRRVLMGGGPAGATNASMGAPGVPPPPPAAPVEPSGFYDQNGEPILLDDEIFLPKRAKQLRDKIASGRVVTSDDPLEAEFDRRTAQAEKAWEDHNKQMDLLLQGAIPLTPAQQQQVDSLRGDFDELKDEQMKANANYQGALKVLGINTGQSRYAPDVALGEMNQAISDGVRKIGRLDAQAAQTIAAMQEAFQKDNFAIIDAAYDDYSSFLEKRQATIQGMQEAAAAAVQAERDWNYKVAQDEIANTFKQGDLDLRVKQTEIDEAYKNATITLEQKKFLADELHKNTAERLAAARFSFDRQQAQFSNQLQLKNGQTMQFDTKGNVVGLTGSGSIPPMSIDQNRLLAVKDVMGKGMSDPESIRNVLNYSDTGKKIADFSKDEVESLMMVAERGTQAPPVSASGAPMQTPFKATDIPGVTQARSLGISYFDPSQFTDPKQAKMAEALARQAGVPIIANKEDQKAIQAVSKTIQDLNDYETLFAELAPEGKAGRVWLDATGEWSEWLSTDYGNKLEKLEALRGSIIASNLKGMAEGTNNRISQSTIDLISGNIPTLRGDEGGLWGWDPMDVSDKGSGVGKLNSARKLLYNSIDGMGLDVALPETGERVYRSTDELLQVHPELKQQAAELANQGYSDSDIRVILNK